VQRLFYLKKIIILNIKNKISNYLPKYLQKLRVICVKTNLIIEFVKDSVSNLFMN